MKETFSLGCHLQFIDIGMQVDLEIYQSRMVSGIRINVSVNRLDNRSRGLRRVVRNVYHSIVILTERIR